MIVLVQSRKVSLIMSSGTRKLSVDIFGSDNPYMKKPMPIPKVKTSRKNKKPEEELAKKVIEFLKLKQFVVVRIDAGSPYLAARGYRIQTKTKPGTSDILAVDKVGRFWAIELKAKGRKSTLSDSQHEFIRRVIENNGVGICIDSLDDLRMIVTKSEAGLLSRDFLFDFLNS